MDPTLYQQLNKNENEFVEFYKQLLLQKICFNIQHKRPIRSFVQLYLKLNDIPNSLYDNIAAQIKQIKEKTSQKECVKLLSQLLQGIIEKINQQYSEQISNALNDRITERQQKRAAEAIKKWNKKF